jgi:predicted nucleic acid-binding protein
VTDHGERPDRGILDTSAVKAMRDIGDATELPTEPLITTVTLAELSAGPLVTRDERERAARQALLQQAEEDFDPLPFDRASARAFGQVSASLRRSGRKTAARAYDALIAATALANGLPVYTCNAADFDGIDGLQVIPVTLPRRVPDKTRDHPQPRLPGDRAAGGDTWSISANGEPPTATASATAILSIVVRVPLASVG